MKEHLLAIAFLGLLFLLYMVPMPESFLNDKDFAPLEATEEEHIHTQQRTNAEKPAPNTNTQDSIRISVVAATRL
ncbi:MAG: hypothetical protein ACI8YQ_000596 [Polaribacter sp.]|jgi:hypothetical protein